MIEVEVKAKILNFNSVKKKLKEINAEKTHEEHQEDNYFNSPLKDFAKTDEALRIRKISINNNQKIFITYKGPKIDSQSKTKEEVEVEIENSEKVAKIFEHLGFKKTAIVIKNRINYTLDKYIISLDEVEGLEPYMEIETHLKDRTLFKEELKKIYDIYKKLGIKNGFERTSYLELLEDTKSKR